VEEWVLGAEIGTAGCTVCTAGGWGYVDLWVSGVGRVVLGAVGAGFWGWGFADGGSVDGGRGAVNGEQQRQEQRQIPFRNDRKKCQGNFKCKTTGGLIWGFLYLCQGFIGEICCKLLLFVGFRAGRILRGIIGGLCRVESIAGDGMGVAW